MQIVLIGYGKMGKCIEQAGSARRHEIIGRIGGREPHITAPRVSSSKAQEIIAKSDICIDFSHPDAVLENTRVVSALGKPLVIGTTGWLTHLKAIEATINRANTGMIWAPNFSLGIHLFLHIVNHSAKIMDHFDNYDVSGFEMHHHQKTDSPSGTAKALAETLLKGIKRKKRILYETANRRIESEEIHFTSLRTGSVPGTHTIIFDSSADTITLMHQARNREGFAQGAITAAEWLQGRKGVFTIEDLIQSILF